MSVNPSERENSVEGLLEGLNRGLGSFFNQLREAEGQEEPPGIEEEPTPASQPPPSELASLRARVDEMESELAFLRRALIEEREERIRASGARSPRQWSPGNELPSLDELSRGASSMLDSASKRAVGGVLGRVLADALKDPEALRAASKTMASVLKESARQRRSEPPGS